MDLLCRKTSTRGGRRRDKRAPSRWLPALAVGLLWLAPSPAGADGLPFTITTGARFGAFYGVANEYVYNQLLSPNYKNSQLVWPLAPMFFSGAALSFDSAFGLFATLDVRQGFAGVAGTMTDSDFLNGDGVRTHYSQSSSYAERANLLDVRAGWDFLRDSGLKVGAFLAFSYMDLKWSARDGYYQYPTSGQPYSGSGPTYVPGNLNPWSPSETQTPIYGTGIIYETAYAGGSVGVRAGYAFSSILSIDGSFAFTPLLSAATEDNHVARQLDFYSTLNGGFMIEPRVAVTWTFLAAASLRLEVGYRYAWNLRGDLTEVNTGTSDFSTSFPYIAGPNSSFTGTNDSGADFSALDAGLVLSISL